VHARRRHDQDEWPGDTLVLVFLLWGLRGGGRRGRILVAARLVLLVAFLLVLFVFHPHGTALDIVQAVRIVLLIALLGSTWMLRRGGRAPSSTPD